MPKLSVLVTFCNQKEYIRENLDSIISQDVDFEYEILICLDGKCQDSEDIINEYLNKYSFIRLFKTDNSNWDVINIFKASKNRLKLLSEAQGEYICFLDGDDFYIDNTRFQKLVSFLDEHSEYIGVFHDNYVYDDKSKQIISKVEYSGKESLDAKNYVKNKVDVVYSNFIYRNIFMGKIPKDLNKNMIDDSSFTYYMLKYGKFYHLPYFMFGYRKHANSIFVSRPDEIQNLYSLFIYETNISILPAYSKYICKRMRHLLRERFNDLKNIDYKQDIELTKIFNSAKENKCYFTFNILNYKNLTLKEKIKFRINLFLAIKFYIYPFSFKERIL